MKQAREALAYLREALFGPKEDYPGALLEEIRPLVRNFLTLFPNLPAGWHDQPWKEVNKKIHQVTNSLPDLYDACRRYIRNADNRQWARVEVAYQRFTRDYDTALVKELPRLLEQLLADLEAIEDEDRPLRERQQARQKI